MRKAIIYYQNEEAGLLEETTPGFRFLYRDSYLNNPQSRPISISLPLRKEVYTSEALFPFFDGLIPEGWFLEITSRKLKVDVNDRFGLLLATASHTIGAVTVKKVGNE